MGELFASDLTLMGTVLAGLALTFVGIFRDLDPARVGQPKPQTPKVDL